MRVKKAHIHLQYNVPVCWIEEKDVLTKEMYTHRTQKGRMHLL